MMLIRCGLCGVLGLFGGVVLHPTWGHQTSRCTTCRDKEAEKND